MADVQGILLNTGRGLITSSMIGFSMFAPLKFRVGNSFGFTPDPADTDIRGALTYEGSSALMTSRRLAEDAARYVCTIPESEGDFDIGNIVFFGTMWNNDPIPLFSVSLPYLYHKQVASPSFEGQPFPTPGSRFICNVTIKHSLEATGVTVTITTPTFASFPTYEDENSVPTPGLNPWSTYIISKDSRTGGPTFVFTDENEVTWGIPATQLLREPNFGDADGGYTGDGYTKEVRSYISGGTFTTDEAVYRGTIGGESFTEAAENFIGNIGGVNWT